MHTHRGSWGRDALILTVLSLMTNALGFLYRVILSRMTGATVMGLYQLVMPVYSVLMSLTAYGLTTAVSNLTARHLARQDTLAARQTVQTGYLIFWLLLLPVGCCAIAGSDFISTALLGDARTQLGIILLVPCVALTGVENLHKYVFYGSGRVIPPALCELWEQLLRILAVFFLLHTLLPQYPERVVGLIVLGMVLCEVCSACNLALLYRRYFLRPPLVGQGEAAKVRWEKILSLSIPVGFNVLLGNLLSAANSALIPRQLVAGGMGREEAMGAFGVLCGMTLPLLSLPTVFLGALTLVLGSRMAQASELKQLTTLRRLLDRAMGLTAALAFPALALLAVVGADLGQVLFHQTGVGRFLLPLALVTGLGASCTVLACTLNNTGQQRAVAAISLLGGGVQLLLSVLLIPGLGLSGFVWAALLSTLLELGLSLLRAKRSTGCTICWFSWFLAPGLAAALAGLCANLLYRVLTAACLPNPWAGLATVVFGGLLALAALQAQGLHLL